MDLFLNGAAWLKADFHLHTNADKEFNYDGDENNYYSDYVKALVKAGIHVGVITNHNKFDFEEFKALKKTAIKQGVFLLPGVELSVGDGRKGIHTIIVFSDEWLENGNDRISTFLSSMFPGKSVEEYQNENGRSDKNILQTVEELEKSGRDYFLIFAHVEDSMGLWHEFGGRLEDWRDGRYKEVRERTLGFQQVKTRDEREKVKQWLGDWYPAEVEGSDPKSIDQIGQKKPCFLKLGAFTFDAVKFALRYYKNRVRTVEPSTYTHSYIREISFTGGILDGKSISFSPELNALIGIRGSGKSAILEIVRYALDIPFGENASDHKYKSELVRYALQSGGKVVVHVVNRFGIPYRIERILNESPVVYCEDKIVPGISPAGTVINKPLYFGQKDLSSSSEGFERDLVEKLVAPKLADARRRIAAQQEVVSKSAAQLIGIDAASARIEELNKEKQDISHRLTVFTQYGIEAKLQKRLDFDADVQFMQNAIADVSNLAQGVENFSEEYILPEIGEYASKNNSGLLDKFITEYGKAKSGFEKITEQLPFLQNTLTTMNALLQELSRNRQGLSEEFAETERRLAQELANENLRVSSDDFLKLKQRQTKLEQELSLLSRSKERNDTAQKTLLTQLAELGNLRHEEFSIIQSELAAVGAHSGALKLSCEYKGDSTAFLDFAKSMFQGSGIRALTFQGIFDSYSDFAELYRNYTEAKGRNHLGSNPELFTDWFNRNLAEFLIYQVPNRFVIKYHDKELKQHSLGQRASALILFILSQDDNDVILIDQPEDDLDNQTIYADVIQLICRLKPKIQFILATHNPNIPVLGDAEQIIACSFAEHAVNIQPGGIDSPQQQQTIVNIMEGGSEAFKMRKEIYQSWN